MKIDEILIDRYGIVSEQKYNFSKNHNLVFIYGDNESGKTLTMDALAKFLLPKKPDPSKKADKYGFTNEQLNRVNYFPQGYVIISDKTGKQHKLQEQNSLYDIFDMPDRSLKNAFIIRDGDLNINEEHNFYQHVTEHITGMRIDDIDKVKKQLRQKYRLTGQLNFSDRDKDLKLLSRINMGEKLVDKITHLLAEAENEGYDHIETILVSYQEQIESIDKEIQQQIMAYYSDKYKRANYYFKQFKNAKEKLKELQNYTQERMEKWKEIERELARYCEEADSTERKIENTQQELSNVQEQRTKLGEKLSEFEGSLNSLTKLKPKIERLLDIKKQLVGGEIKQNLLGNARITLASLGGLSLIVSFFYNGGFLWIISVVFLILTATLIIPDWLRAKKWSDLEKEFIQIKNKLIELVPWNDDHNRISEVDNLEELIRWVSGFEQKYQFNYKKYYEDILPQEKNLKDQLRDLKNQQKKLQDKISTYKDDFRQMRMSSGVDSIEEYMDKINQKNGLRRELDLSVNALNNIFATKKDFPNDSYEGDISTAEKVNFWYEKITELFNYVKVEVDVEYSQSELENLRIKKHELSEKITQLNNKMENYREKLSEIGDQAVKVLYPEGHRQMVCSSTTNLIDIKNKLTEFLQQQKWIQTAATELDTILNEVEQEERQKVVSIFNHDGNISGYFRELTKDNYQAVVYDEQTHRISCKKKDGVYLDASQLSGFTWDQLYFCVRLVLAERLMRGNKGFLLLDDPFVKADHIRLRKQLEMIANIAHWGWQVIYFTAKNEVMEIAEGLRSTAHP